LLFLTMGVIWGVPYLLIKVAVGTLSPATLVFFRTAIAALMLVPLAAGRGQLRPALARWRPVLLFTATELAVPWFFLASAERRLSSSLSGLLIAAVPLIGSLLGWVTGGERLGPRRLLGLLIGLLGVASLVGLDLHVSDGWAVAQLGLVAVGYAVGPFVLSRYLSDTPGLGVMAVSLALTSVVYLPFALTQLPAHPPSARVIAAVITLSVVCTAVAFLVFFALIAEVGPVRSTVITYVNPAVAVLLGVLLLNEPFTVGIAVGFALVLTGSVLATRRRRGAPSDPARPSVTRVRDGTAGGPVPDVLRKSVRVEQPGQ
jgi:drug/metabolite transporter (DMT)-like permease